MIMETILTDGKSELHIIYCPKTISYEFKKLKEVSSWESSIEIYTQPCVKQIARGKQLYNTRSSATCSDNLAGWDGGAQEEGDIGIHMADSGCLAETNITL